MQLSVTLDTRAAQRSVDEAGRAARRAGLSAVRRTVPSVRAEAVREVRKQIHIRQADARKAITIRNRPTRVRPEGSIILSGRPLPVAAFSPRQRRSGVSVRIKQAAGRQLLPGAFLARLRSGHVGVFYRRRSGGRRVGRLPIDQVFTTAVSGALRKRLDHLQAFAARRLRVEFERAVRFFRLGRR